MIAVKDKKTNLEWVGTFTEEALPVTTSTPEVLSVKRQEAFEIYKVLPNPTPFTEDWRRTHPSLFPFDAFSRLDSLPLTDSPSLESDPLDEEFDVVVTVSEDGVHIVDRSGLIEAGKLDVLTLGEAATRDPEAVQQYLQSDALAPNIGKFEALNAAFWNLGLFIRARKGVEVQRGILIRQKFKSASAALVSRQVIVMESMSSLGITEWSESPNGVPMLVVADREMNLGEGARLKTVALKCWGDETYLLGNDMARVERDGLVDQMNFNFGGKVAKLKFGSDLAGPNSAAELDGLFFTTKDQHIDQTTWQVHSSPDTYSRLLYKGAVRDESQSVYQGIIKATPGAIRVDAYQTNNNIVLNDGARAHTIPGLLIDADDLKCSHGATIGNLDETQIFYLRSRGIPEAEARRLVMLGFFEEVTQRIPQDFIRERVQQIIRERMPEAVQETN